MYTLLWCIYSLQSILGISGIIAQGVLALVLTMSGYYMLKVLRQYKTPVFLKCIALFLGVYMIYTYLSFLDPTPIYVEFDMATPITATASLKPVLMSLLPVYAYYYFVRIQLIKRIEPYLYICLLLATAQFFIQEKILMMETVAMGVEREEFTNNIAYDFVHLIPFLFVIGKKKLLRQYVLLLYILCFILLGMKRGAILIGAVLALYFLYVSYKSMNNKGRTYIILLSLAVIIGVVVYINYLLETSEYFNYRIESTMDGASSGRDMLYAQYLDHMRSRTSVIAFLFGEGINKTIAITGLYAHNDWLELGINFGLLGIVLYLLYFIGLYRAVCKASQTNRTVFHAMMAMSFLLFATTLFSMSYNAYTLGLQVCMGYSLAMLSNKPTIMA